VLRRRPRTKPNYQAALGAYASTPRLAKTDGAYRARGSIQAWRGSIEDLGRVGEEAHEALAEQGEQPTITGIVTLWSGKQRQLSSVDEFCAEATAVSEEQISSLRIGLAQGPMLGTIVARRTMPGVVVDVRGPNRIAVDGLARLMFTSAMGGYVDRYNGIWRPTGALATTLVPVGLFVGVGTRISDKWPAWAVVLYGVAALVATFTIMVNSWQWTLVRTPLELVPDDAAQPERAELRARVTAVLRRRRVSRVVALIGVIALGVATNKLSDLLPWP
jgi:hypothetical protein